MVFPLFFTLFTVNMAKDGQDANVNLDVETEENVNTNHELNASALMT